MLCDMHDLQELSTLSGIPPEQFAEAVFNRYAQRLMSVARERIGTQLRSKVSPEDVVQSAFKSFFRRQDEFKFEKDGDDGLWGLLVVITVRKCAKWADVYTAEKRSASREVSLNSSPPGGGSGLRDVVAREPGPTEVAVLSELIERMLARLDERQQQMISLRMHGYDLEEIAEQLNSSRRTVSRTIQEAKEVLRQLIADSA
jgi:RNA polymerase sigma-70 factor, ECF subfamily